MLKSSKQNRVKDWAVASFAALRENLELGAVEKTLRHYAEQPECQYMHYSGFTALASDMQPSLSSVEIGKLWCVLDKVDGMEEPAVGIGELVRWMAPRHHATMGHSDVSLMPAGHNASSPSQLAIDTPSPGMEPTY